MKAGRGSGVCLEFCDPGFGSGIYLDCSFYSLLGWCVFKVRISIPFEHQHFYHDDNISETKQICLNNLSTFTEGNYIITSDMIFPISNFCDSFGRKKMLGNSLFSNKVLPRCYRTLRFPSQFSRLCETDQNNNVADVRGPLC